LSDPTHRAEAASSQAVSLSPPPVSLRQGRENSRGTVDAVFKSGRGWPRLMTAKDYIYLGLLAFSAIIFYLNGYYSGVNRTRRLFERVFIDQPAAATEERELPLPEIHARPSVDELQGHRGRKITASATIRTMFGKN
jgi:hypothetical protein